MENGDWCPEYDVATTIVITTAHVTGAINRGWRNYTIYNRNTCVTIVTNTWPLGSGPTLQHIFLNVHSSLQAKSLAAVVLEDGTGLGDVSRCGCTTVHTVCSFTSPPITVQSKIPDSRPLSLAICGSLFHGPN